MPAGTDDLLRLLVQRLQSQAGAVLDLQLEAADRAQALNRRRREDRDVRVLDRRELLVQRSRDLVRGTRLLEVRVLEIAQRHECDADVRRIDETVDRETGERDRVRDAGLGQHDVRRAADDFLGPIERRCFRQLRERDEILLVLLRHEAFRHAPEAEVRHADERDVENRHAAGPRERLARETDVALGQPLEEAVERPDRPAEHEVDAALEAVRLGAVRLAAATRRARATASTS